MSMNTTSDDNKSVKIDDCSFDLLGGSMMKILDTRKFNFLSFFRNLLFYFKTTF